MDPLADKLLVVSAIICLMGIGWVPPLVVILIIVFVLLLCTALLQQMVAFFADIYSELVNRA